MTMDHFRKYFEELYKASKKGTERELEIIAEKEGNSIEVQKIKKKILKTKAGSWFGAIITGYIVEKYYQLTGQI